MSQQQQQKVKKTAPLVIKHKGKTYLVPVVDQKLQKELEKRSKAENPSVTIRQAALGVSSRVGGSGSNTREQQQQQNHGLRSFASPPKMDATDHAAPHMRRRNSSKSSPQRATSKKVTNYGVL